ncbi:hypothetical protein [Pseudomonas chlororaphis]|uniref:hypothetical protein n=1 Tax=Pseudomonas chlororaphis TaxID=587753 RepID=UPI0018AF83F3|nr:hypothetical protein [Pseudomonas chlororaphis]
MILYKYYGLTSGLKAIESRKLRPQPSSLTETHPGYPGGHPAAPRQVHLDVIRCYPCIELKRQHPLRDLIDLKVSFRGGPLTDLLHARGLDEADIPNTKAILPYQTRHYATERRK